MKTLSQIKKVIIGISLLASLAMVNACAGEKARGDQDTFNSAGQRAKLGSNADANAKTKESVSFQSDNQNDGADVKSAQENDKSAVDSGKDNAGNTIDPAKESMDPTIAKACDDCRKKCESINKTTECGKKKYDQCVNNCNTQNQNMCKEVTPAAQLL